MTDYKRQDPELAYEPADQGFNSEIQPQSERSPEEIEREIEQTRDRMSRNIDELGDRLSPSNLKQEAKSAIKDAAQGAVSNVGEHARRTSYRLVEVIRENPLPVIAVGAGVTWLLTQRSRSDVSGSRMARYAYTGPERRQGNGGQRGPGIRDRVGGTVSGVKDSVSEAASGVAERASELKERAEENPLLLAIGATVVGMALGLLLPGTQRENEMMGSARDQLVDRAEETVERAKEAAVEAGREVKETVKSEFEQHKPELKEVVQQAGQSVKDQVKDSARRVKDEAKDAAKKSGNSPRRNS